MFAQPCYRISFLICDQISENIQQKGGGGDDTRSRWVCKYFYLELPTKCIHMILKIFYFPLTQKENIP